MDKDKFILSLLENWDRIEKISSQAWKKIRELFEKGDKSIAFIKRPEIFNQYYELSQKSFLNRYSRFIIPAEYGGYILEALSISELYKKGKKDIADRKRTELSSVAPSALRIYNLYNTGILGTVFSLIDRLISEGKNDSEVRGSSSKLLDDLINDKSIIYAHLYHDKIKLYKKVKRHALKKGYCLIYGSGNNVTKIKYIHTTFLDDDDLDDFEAKTNKRKIGGIIHYNLFIVQKIILEKY